MKLACNTVSLWPCFTLIDGFYSIALQHNTVNCTVLYCSLSRAESAFLKKLMNRIICLNPLFKHIDLNSIGVLLLIQSITLAWAIWATRSVYMQHNAGRNWRSWSHGEREWCNARKLTVTSVWSTAAADRREERPLLVSMAMTKFLSAFLSLFLSLPPTGLP